VLDGSPAGFGVARLAPLREGAHSRAIDWSKIERLAPYGGIRIEDNVAVTGGEPENLTRDGFRRLASD
jgi:Xaa-Pro dipeptidase